MTPLQLFDLCTDAVARWQSCPANMRAEAPFVLLTIAKSRIPKGDKMRAFGRSGPLGTICNVKTRSDGKFDVTGYWPAVPILRELVAMVQPKEPNDEGKGNKQ